MTVIEWILFIVVIIQGAGLIVLAAYVKELIRAVEIIIDSMVFVSDIFGADEDGGNDGS